MVTITPTKEEVIVAFLKMTKQPTKHLMKKATGVPSRKPRELDPTIVEVLGKDEGIQVEIRIDSKTLVDWINGKAKSR